MKDKNVKVCFRIFLITFKKMKETVTYFDHFFFLMKNNVKLNDVDF